MFRMSWAICLMLVLAACGPQPAPSMPYAAPGVQFTVTPMAGNCRRATVAWLVPATMPAKTEVQVDDIRKVFTRSNDRVGHEDTGDWVAEGQEFYLLDRESGKVLAAVQAGSEYCSTAAGKD